MIPIIEESIKKFLSKTNIPDNSDECWLWRDASTYQGYGRFYFYHDGFVDSDTAHRISYRIFHGEIPSHLFVLHKCDVRMCVYPSHLFAGTQRENVADMDRKGRGKHWGGNPFGEKAKNARLTQSQVDEIRATYIPRSRSYSQRALARKFGVAQATIYYVLSGGTWPDDIN